jgi:Flp pilus assembly protein TadB
MVSPHKTPRKGLPAKPAFAAAATKSAPAKSTRVAKREKAAKAERTAEPAVTVSQKREKLVRDSFTIPKGEYAMLDVLKQRASGLTRPAKKSELVRAGVKALAAMDDATFLAVLRGVPSIKTGRPPSAATVAEAPAPKAGKS